jgi:hypothetical protein
MHAREPRTPAQGSHRQRCRRVARCIHMDAPLSAGRRGVCRCPRTATRHAVDRQRPVGLGQAGRIRSAAGRRGAHRPCGSAAITIRPRQFCVHRRRSNAMAAGTTRHRKLRPRAAGTPSTDLRQLAAARLARRRMAAIRPRHSRQARGNMGRSLYHRGPSELRRGGKGMSRR